MTRSIFRSFASQHLLVGGPLCASECADVAVGVFGKDAVSARGREGACVVELICTSDRLAAGVSPGHGDDTTLGAERPHLGEWKERGW
jgi:hypothetical protein